MVLITNPDAYRNYQILEEFQAGLELKGFEVRSLFLGRGSLKGAYVSHFKNELYLKNFHIPPYQEKNIPKNYDPQRPRKLLLKRKEINYLINQLKQKKFIIIPLQVYNKNRLIKVKIALARGLKKYEKREKIKEREFQRQKERALKGRI